MKGSHSDADPLVTAPRVAQNSAFYQSERSPLPFSRPDISYSEGNRLSTPPAGVEPSWHTPALSIPNPLAHTDPTTWGQSAPSTGPSWMNDNALLRIPSASAGLSAPYSGGVQQPGFGTPTYLTFDPALLLRPNRLLEPMRPDNPFGAGPMGQEGQTDPRVNNLLGPWPGVYPWRRKDLLYPDVE